MEKSDPQSLSPQHELQRADLYRSLEIELADLLSLMPDHQQRNVLLCRLVDEQLRHCQSSQSESEYVLPLSTALPLLV